MKKLSAVIILVLSSLSTGSYAGNYSVGVENLDYLPFSGVEQGEFKGYFRDLLDKFAADNGHTFSYTPLPVKRLSSDYFGGKLDFKIPDNSFWSQSLKIGKTITYSSPVTTYVDGLMVRPDKKGTPYPQIESIVTVRGFTPFPFMDDIAKGSLRLRESSSFEPVLKMAESGRVDAAFVNVNVAEYYMAHVMKKPGALVFDGDLPKGESAISLSTMSQPALIDEFNQWLAKNTAIVDSLKRKYKID